ncbi:MAG: WbqC family protein [Segetibacter sp.]|nr:WbqC family protein [Segetibacter sp.]
MQLIETQYFPTIDWFKIVKQNTDICILLYEYYRKASFRNRAIISGSNALIALSIPIKGGRERKEWLNEVEVNDVTNWRANHWRAIESSYRKAPFFEFYNEIVKNLIFSKHVRLVELNKEIIVKLCTVLKISPFSFDCGEQSEISVQHKDLILPKNFQDQADWKPKYSQVFEEKNGFQQNLSILDLLFNEGPNAANLLDTPHGYQKT